MGNYEERLESYVRILQARIQTERESLNGKEQLTKDQGDNLKVMDAPATRSLTSLVGALNNLYDIFPEVRPKEESYRV